MRNVTADFNMLNLIDAAIRIGKFQTFCRLLERLPLEQKLTGPRIYTLFAPLDQAFSDPTSTILGDLLESKNGWKLAAVVGHHVVPGKITLRELGKLRTVKTEVGQTLTISDVDGVKINEARVVVSDIEARNGIIHGIDMLLMPRIAIQHVRGIS